MENNIILQGIRKEDLIESVADEVFKKVEEYIKATQAPNKMLDRKEAAEYLNISARTLDTITSSGKLRYTKIESVVRFKKTELDAYISRNEVRIKKFV